MEEKVSSRNEVLIAGLGGMGVLMAGQLLAWAAFQQYEYVSWLPSYGVQPRGGLSECTVIFSNEKIKSPILDQAQAVMLFDGSQLKVMEPRVRYGGLMIVDKSGLREEKERKDIKLLVSPAIEIAIDSFGGPAASNLIHLGTFIRVTEAVPAELIEQEMEKRFGRKESVLTRNKEAFRRGLELAKSLTER